MDKEIIVILGDNGNGKSTLARQFVILSQTTVLGTGSRLREFLTLNWGGITRHIQDNRILQVAGNKQVTLNNINNCLANLVTPHVIIDEWSDFFYSSWFRSSTAINHTATLLLNTIQNNQNIKTIVIVTRKHIPWIPFKLYKKMALWNKAICRRADKIVDVVFEVPVWIKS